MNVAQSKRAENDSSSMLIVYGKVYGRNCTFARETVTLIISNVKSMIYTIVHKRTKTVPISLTESTLTESQEEQESQNNVNLVSSY